MPGFDLDAAFLTLLTDPASMGAVLESGVRGIHFADPEMAQLVDGARDYFVRGRLELVPTRPMIEADHGAWIRERGGWPADEYLASELCGRVMERYRRNLGQAIAEELGRGLFRDSASAMAKAADDMARVLRETTPGERATNYGLAYPDRYQAYVDRVTAGNRPQPGVPLGWREVTEHTFGIQPGETAVVVARTQLGKSWCLAKIALEAAEQGHRVYLASLENAKELTLMRMDCLFTGVPYHAYERGRLNLREADLLQGGIVMAAEVVDRLLIDHPRRSTDRTLFDLYSRARAHGADILVGDQLSHVHMEGRFATKTEEMGQKIIDIVDLSKDFGVASVWAAQFNREAMHVRGGRGGTEHIGLSDQIGNYVDWAISLTADRDMRSAHTRLLEIIKARRGPLAAWLMQWELEDRTELRVDRSAEEE